ncbi:hypothetical protein P171DRAFT_437628 [Karstenula rhodostoma CBS 690.94]|uniref:F-box domain-containing protein n=1 Tax=Karstenula rhodostoma CBS 690.94 TaxID=1392251 RepID=A0A9P4P3B2_9PLEO|nr:hypothetical protein P171DRAFT_437628 [Karstenula rhodostoma CBS 690.94]
MALTRAGKKRELGSPALSSGKGQATKKAKNSNKAKTPKKGSAAPASLAAQEKKNKPKGLVDMPPEIRNRIYHFATERDNFEGWEDAVPLIDMHTGHGCGRSQWPMSKYECSLSARNFLGLTQTCKLIRKEYRPIWLRNSSIRVLPRYLSVYIHTFYGCGADYSTNMPKLIQISHCQDAFGQNNLDLTEMLRMHAASPATKFEFVPHELTQEEGLWNDRLDDCFMCEEEIMFGETDIDELEENGCPHFEEHREAFADFLLMEQYPYLLALDKFLAHDNAKWLADIQDREVIRVKLDTYDGEYGSPDVTIRLRHGSEIVTQKLKKKSMSDAASDYIKDRSLRDVNTGHASLHFQLQICGGSHGSP